MHGAAQTPTASRDRLYALGLTALFLLCNAAILSRHEMWLDEIQAWLIARDSASILDLFRNLKYEGHPGLWHLLLMPLTRLFASPVAMQGLHLVIGTATVSIFARHSPFSWLVKLLFAFGYFPFYEYAVISRNYSIGVLLLFLFCALFKKRFTHLPLLGFVLFLLCHTNALGLLLAIVISGVLLAERLLSPRHQATEAQEDPRLNLAGFALMFLGIATSVLQIIPPADSGFATAGTWVPQFNLLRRIITVAVAPIPNLQLNFWGTTIWGGNLLSPLFSLFTLALLALLTLRLLRKPPVLAAFLGGTAIMLAFFNFKYEGSPRHHGHLFLLFMAANWLAASSPDLPILARLPAFGPRAARLFQRLVLCLLALHVAGAGVAGWQDYRLPFCTARQVAEHIRAQDLDRLTLVGLPDMMTVPVLGYLGKDRAWYPQRGSYGSYVIWDRARLSRPELPAALEQARALADREGREVLLFCNATLGPAAPGEADVVLLHRFESTATPGETPHLYLVRPALRERPAGD